MARTSVDAKLLAAMDAAPEEEKEEDVPMAELLRRERAEAAAAVQAQADLARREAERAQKEIELELELARRAEELDELRKKQEEEERVAARWAAMAEMERKTKRFFDVNPETRGRQLECVTTGGVYFGDYDVLGDDWVPSGWGEFRAPTGATIYEGEWSRGLRHGAGTLYFETGDEWRGTFHLDEARGLGVYKFAGEEDAETGALEVRERDAYYHRDARAAWYDEVVPGRRVFVPSFRLENVGDAGTVVGRPAGPRRRAESKYLVHFDLSGERRVVDFAVVYFRLLVKEPLMHRFEHAQERTLRRYDYAADVAARATSDYAENFYRDEVPTKAKPPAPASEDGRAAFLRRKADLARAAAAESKAASLGDALTANQEAAAATDEEEAKFQAEVQRQIDARQSARRNRKALMRGGLTAAKSDAAALRDITRPSHERDIVTENLRAGV